MVTWATAETECLKLGMNLARIDDRKEHEWLHRIFGQYTPWLGLNDINKENDYVNSDGCPQKFVTWAERQPNNSGDEDCVQLSSRRGWNDNQCSRMFRFLCKRSDRRVRGQCGEIIYSK